MKNQNSILTNWTAFSHCGVLKNYSIFTWTSELPEKFQNTDFFGDILNSFNWVTQIGPKTTPKNLFENISKTTGATVVQNFGILDGAADLRVEI